MSIFTSDIKTDVIAIFIACVAVTIAYFKWAFSYWKRKGVETPPTKIPFGNATNALLVRRSLGEELADVYHEYKKKRLRYCGYYMIFKAVFVVLDPELIKSMMTKDFQHFSDHANYLNEKADPLSGNLFSLKGLKWKHLRTKLTPTFTSGKMKMMFQTLLNCSDELVVIMDKAVNGNEAVEIKEIVGRFTTDIIGNCGFGIDCNSLKDPKSEFREYGKRALDQSYVQAAKNLVSICLPEVLNFFDVAVTRKDVTNFFMDIVNQTVKYREKTNLTRKDFMHLLIQLRNNVKIRDDDDGALRPNGVPQSGETEQNFSMEELTAQAFIFFLAGFETSSTTITFCFYELVNNQKIQNKLRSEINEVLARHDGKLSYDAIMEMSYMEKCINETLRKYPPVNLLSRECTIPYKIPNSDITLSKGTPVFIPILGIQHDPEYYPDPEKFDPERFSPENKATRPAFTWLPFGEGPRVCIGMRFGMMQTKVALTILLQNYMFSLNSKTKTPLVMDPKSLAMSVEGGIWLDVKKIH